MLITVLSSAAAFVSTELDDLLSLFILMGAARDSKDKVAITLGKYFGLILLCLCSALFASYLSKVPGHLLGLLGLLPILIGLKEIVESFRGEDKELAEKDLTGFAFLKLMTVTVLVTVADGGDNIAVYIPYFTSLSGWDFLVSAVVFFVLQGAFCACAWFIVNLDAVKKVLDKTKKILVPVLFIGLGLFIMWEAGTFAWLLGVMNGTV